VATLCWIDDRRRFDARSAMRCPSLNFFGDFIQYCIKKQIETSKGKDLKKWNFQTRSNMEFGCYGLELVLYVLYIVTHANTRLSRAKRIYDRRRLDTSWDIIGFFHNHVD